MHTKSILLGATVAFLLVGCGGTLGDPVVDGPVFDPERVLVDIWDDSGRGPTGAICDDMLIQPELTPPNLLLLVDKSGSMNQAISADSTRKKMDDTKDAIQGLLQQGDGSIQFGFMPYPGNSSCDAGNVAVDCDVTATGEIGQRVSDLGTGGGTPTGPALEVALDYAPLHDESRPNFVVLLTDGKPTCPSGDGGTETDEDARAAIDAATALHQNAIDTFVVGIGEDLNASNPDILNEVAQAGGRPRPGAVKYYQANSLNQLNEALAAIGEAVIGCTFTLTTEPAHDRYLWVTFDGRLVERDAEHKNGWDYDATHNQVTAYGAACSMLQAGQVEAVEISIGCDPLEWDPPA